MTQVSVEPVSFSVARPTKAVMFHKTSSHPWGFFEIRHMKWLLYCKNLQWYTEISQLVYSCLWQNKPQNRSNFHLFISPFFFFFQPWMSQPSTMVSRGCRRSSPDTPVILRGYQRSVQCLCSTGKHRTAQRHSCLSQNALILWMWQINRTTLQWTLSTVTPNRDSFSSHMWLTH